MAAKPETEAGMATIDRAALPTHTFDWGATKWLVSPSTTPGATLTFGEVLVLPGKGHERHNHPDAEEVLYVLSGEGEQMVADGEPFLVRAGDVLYNPGGSELALTELPDFREVPAGQQPGLRRA